MQLHFPRDKEVPSVEMLQKRLDSLREIPNTAEDDAHPSEASQSNEQSPMDTQENTPSVSDTVKDTPSSQEDKNDNTQQDVPEQDNQSVDLNHGDDQLNNNPVTPQNDDKSFTEDNKNGDVPFTGEDDKPLPGDNTIMPKEYEKFDTPLSDKEQKDDGLSSEDSQKDDTALPKSPNSNVQLLDPSSPKEKKNQIDQLPSQNTGTPPQEKSPKGDTPPPEKRQRDNTPPPFDNPKDDEEQSSLIETNSTDQPLKLLNDTKHSSEGDVQPPTLQKSVTAPPSKLCH